MFRNYFKIGIRNILKNKLSSFINAFGLALAIGCCLVVFRFVNWIYYPDTFHNNLDEIFVVERLVNEDGERTLWGNIPEPLGPAMISNIPQVVNQSRFRHSGANFKREGEVFNEWITFVDSSFYSIFDFPIKWGNEANFSKQDAIVLSEKAAKKHFGEENPVGREIQLGFNNNGVEKEHIFIIQGVMAKPPENASFSFNAFLPYSVQKGLLVEDFNDWTRHNSTLFLQVNSSDDIAAIQEQVPELLMQYNEANKGWPTEALHFQPLKKMIQHSYTVTNSPFFSTHIAALIILIVIAGALLALACFNYMNIAVASATTRMKEIGVRKVMGGNRSQLIVQFLSENLILCFLSVMIGLMLAQTLFLPWFSKMGDFDFGLNLSNDLSLWLFLGTMTVLTAIGGAGYPAFYLSAFQPVKVLKNKLHFGGKNRFRKALLGAQFLLSFLAIFAAIMFLAVSNEAQQKPWGYTQKGIIDIRLENGEDFEKLKNELQHKPGVQSIAGSHNNIGIWAEQLVAKVAGQEYNVSGLSVGHNYLETMEVDLLEGSYFDRLKSTDLQQSLIVNEQFQHRMGWTDVIGQKVEIDSQAYLVIGQVKDFHQEPFDSQIPPMVIRLTESENFGHLLIRTPPDRLQQTTEEVEATWKALYPNAAFDYHYQDAAFRWYFNSFDQVNSVFKATAFLTILISAIGLFGLAMLILSRKMKELSIRKVLGASVLDISYHINKEFLLTILLATLAGIPIGYFLLRAITDLIFPDAVMRPGPFFLAFGCLVLMTVLSVSRHIYVAVVSNPSHFLKDE